MKVRLLLLLSFLLFSPSVYAQPRASTALGYQQMTSLAAATALPSVPSGTSYVFIICETQSIRWRDDGTNPTASVGNLLPINTPLVYSASIPALKIIQTTASATCNVSYYS